MTCCVSDDPTNDCGVDNADTNTTCHCDASCFDKGDCCSDVIALGCQPGMYVAMDQLANTVEPQNPE